jgi:hypothetical protein
MGLPSATIDTQVVCSARIRRVNVLDGFVTVEGVTTFATGLPGGEFSEVFGTRAGEDACVDGGGAAEDFSLAGFTVAKASIFGELLEADVNVDADPGAAGGDEGEFKEGAGVDSDSRRR